MITTQLPNALTYLGSSQVATIIAYAVLYTMIYFGPFAPLLLIDAVGLTGLAGGCVLGEDAGPLIDVAHSNGPGRAGLARD
ncbi:hypothetical protein [Mycobacterium leprae]|nr:hypothetical protein [Mycobacterium leprae]